MEPSGTARGGGAADARRSRAAWLRLLASARAVDAAHPACLLILVDRSLSVSVDPRAARSRGRTLDAVAATAGRLADALPAFATAAPSLGAGLWVGVVGYSGPLTEDIDSSGWTTAVSPLAERARRDPCSAPWLRSGTEGSTAMCAALRRASELLSAWTRRHARGFPPVVLHLTDGQSSDGDPDEALAALRAVRTRTGESVLVTVLFSHRRRSSVAFPASDRALPDAISRKFYRTASRVPPWLRTVARTLGLPVAPRSRALLVDVDLLRALRRAPLVRGRRRICRAMCGRCKSASP